MYTQRVYMILLTVTTFQEGVIRRKKNHLPTGENLLLLKMGFGEVKSDLKQGL